MEKKCCWLKNILIIVGAIVAVAGIAFAVYKLFIEDDFDEFDEELLFDDDDIADLVDEESEEE